VLCQRTLFQARDPMAIEFVYDSIDSVTLQPSVPERARISKRRLGTPLREPRVATQLVSTNWIVSEVAARLLTSACTQQLPFTLSPVNTISTITTRLRTRSELIMELHRSAKPDLHK